MSLEIKHLVKNQVQIIMLRKELNLLTNKQIVQLNAIIVKV